MILYIEITDGLDKRIIEVYRENDKIMCNTKDAKFNEVELAEKMFLEIEKSKK